MEKLTYCFQAPSLHPSPSSVGNCPHLTARSEAGCPTGGGWPPLMTACVTASRGSRGPGFLAELTSHFKKKKEWHWEAAQEFSTEGGGAGPGSWCQLCQKWPQGQLPLQGPVSSTVNRRMGTSSWRIPPGNKHWLKLDVLSKTDQGRSLKEESQNSPVIHIPGVAVFILQQWKKNQLQKWPHKVSHLEPHLDLAKE